MTSEQQLEIGQLFAGKYKIKRFLGRGGMSTVYEATNEKLQMKVAVKILSEDLTVVPEAVERFIREGIAASRVRHRAIVQVFDAGESDGTPWMAMEVLEGEALNEKLKREGSLNIDEVIRISREVVSGLIAAHDHGVIHRDLKPHNIFLDSTQSPPQPKILDFGIAKLGDANLAKLTQTGVMMGTPHYMAPEQARGESTIGPTADFWALGVIMLEALTGQMPYEAQSVAVYIGKLISDAPRDVRKLAKGVPDSILSLIELCLKPNPADRPPNARWLLSELERIFKHTDSGAQAAISPTLAGAPKTIREEDTHTDDSQSDHSTSIETPPGKTGESQVQQTKKGFTSAPQDPEGPLISEPVSTNLGVPTQAPSAPPVNQPADVAHAKGVAETQAVFRDTDVVAPPAEQSESLIEAQPVKPRKSKLKPIILAILAIALVASGVVGAVFGYNAFLADDSEQDAGTQPDSLATTIVDPTNKAGTQQTVGQQKKSTSPDVSHLLPGNVNIRSNPERAEVFINGLETNAKTPTIMMLHPGQVIEVRHKGYESLSRPYQPGTKQMFFELRKQRKNRRTNTKSTSKGSGTKSIKTTKDINKLAEQWSKQLTRQLEKETNRLKKERERREKRQKQRTKSPK